MHHPQLGMIELEFSTFTVDGRPDLNMMVFNPATEASRVKIHAWVKQGSRHLMVARLVTYRGKFVENQGVAFQRVDDMPAVFGRSSETLSAGRALCIIQ
jgi:hypothetical protein